MYKEPAEKVANVKKAKSSAQRKTRNKQKKKSRENDGIHHQALNMRKWKTKDSRRKLQGGKGKDYLPHLICQPMAQHQARLLKLLIS